jgi:hypothetical protein
MSSSKKSDLERDKMSSSNKSDLERDFAADIYLSEAPHLFYTLS